MCSYEYQFWHNGTSTYCYTCTHHLYSRICSRKSCQNGQKEEKTEKLSREELSGSTKSNIDSFFITN